LSGTGAAVNFTLHLYDDNGVNTFDTDVSWETHTNGADPTVSNPTAKVSNHGGIFDLIEHSITRYGQPSPHCWRFLPKSIASDPLDPGELFFVNCWRSTDYIIKLRAYVNVPVETQSGTFMYPAYMTGRSSITIHRKHDSHVFRVLDFNCGGDDSDSDDSYGGENPYGC
jgi:hypothetical protein